jgi:hypothetical protein
VFANTTFAPLAVWLTGSMLNILMNLNTDTCMTSLFAGTWMCRLCGREVCGDCYERIKEVTYLPDPKNATDAQKKALALRREQLGNTCINLSCSKKREHSNADFTPLTRFEQTELDKAIRGMKDIIKEEATHKQDAAQKPAITSFMSRTPPDNVRTLAAPTHRTPYFHVNELKPEVFQYLWSQGEPLVVGGLLPHMQQSWTPDFFTTDPIKSEECTLVECQSNTTKKTTVRAFFSTFGDYEGRSEVWKLKVAHYACLCVITSLIHGTGLAFDDRVQGSIPSALRRFLQHSPHPGLCPTQRRKQRRVVLSHQLLGPRPRYFGRPITLTGSDV